MTTSTLTGLTAADVAERVARGQVNAVPSRSSRGVREILVDNVFNLFNLTIAVLLGILLAMGEYGDTLFAGLTVVLNVLIGLIQELRAKQALDKLAALSAATVRVRRDGQTLELPTGQVVVDDLIEVLPGDRVVVDGPCVWGEAVEVDESLITGESDWVAKAAGDTLTSGSFVVAGRALMRAEKIGAEAYANRLGAAARAFRLPPTPMQQKISAIVAVSVVGMAVFGPLVIAQGLMGGEDWRSIVKDAVVLVTTFVPQGVVLATTVALSFGAVQIGRRHVLVQRINAIESMGNVTVLCFDKTGTLTQNRLSVQEVVPAGATTPEQARAALALYAGTLAAPNKTAATIAAYAGAPADPPAKVAEIAFNSTRKWGATTFADGRTLILGAPELLLADDGLRARAAGFAARGLRVLALAAALAPVQGDELPVARAPLCLIVMQDMLRGDIDATLRGFAGQSIAVKVISGDNADTVAAIARSAGLAVRQTVTEDELAALDSAAFRNTVARANVFARIKPDTKRRIVNALAAQGQYVAMVGDGVNDVPALKAARMGIAMQDGAQMAKDVADLVLLDNALSTLLVALREGQSITQKIYATTKLFLIKNLYTVVAIVLIGFMGLPFPADVRQLTLVTILSASLPSLLVTLGLLRPRPVRSFQRQVLAYVGVAGLLGGVVLTIGYAAAYFASGRQETTARSVLAILASLYGVMIFWDVHGVVPFEPVTLRHNQRESVLGALLLAAALLIPLFYGWPFRIELLGPEYWLGIIVLSVAAAFALWRSNLERARWLAPVRVLLGK
jgi:cation-transporting ATPase E